MSTSRSTGQFNQQQISQKHVVDDYQANSIQHLPTDSTRQFGGHSMMPIPPENIYIQQQHQHQQQHDHGHRISNNNINHNNNGNNNNDDNTNVDCNLSVNNISNTNNNVNIVDSINPWDLSQDWFDSISRQLIEHMTQFGICVIDNFLGIDKGRAIFNEVEQLYSSKKYSNGSLVNDRFAYNKNDNSSSSADPGAIRNDRVIWVNGKEQFCSQINNLIQTLSSVITNSSTLSLYSNNELDKIVINKRTKAHVSCYPGNGTRYVKHVDNPNCDGRLITAIYYLNENWNTKREGGLLRMFPTGSNQVANIEPLFDRALFFWSDRRNPHEVLPAYRDRYAITVWFMGNKRP